MLNIVSKFEKINDRQWRCCEACLTKGWSDGTESDQRGTTGRKDVVSRFFFVRVLCVEFDGALCVAFLCRR